MTAIASVNVEEETFDRSTTSDAGVLLTNVFREFFLYFVFVSALGYIAHK